MLIDSPIPRVPPVTNAMRPIFVLLVVFYNDSIEVYNPFTNTAFIFNMSNIPTPTAQLAY